MTAPAEIARLRQGLYRFLGRSLAPPDATRLDELRAAAEYLDAIDLTSYSFHREWKALANVLESGVSASEAAHEHVRLFASGTGGVLCPPIESFYRAAGRREATAGIVTAILHDYGDLGISHIALGDAPDDATTQLEIMSMLCAEESAAWDAPSVREAARLLDIEATFISHHLAAWFPQFRKLVREAGADGFYVAVVDATHSFIIHDADLITALRGWSGAVA